MSQLMKNMKDMLTETVAFLLQALFMVGILVMLGCLGVISYRIVTLLLW
jgi:uncharacterized membrane protein YqjE